jgi:hypothetical protein
VAEPTQLYQKINSLAYDPKFLALFWLREYESRLRKILPKEGHLHGGFCLGSLWHKSPIASDAHYVLGGAVEDAGPEVKERFFGRWVVGIVFECHARSPQLKPRLILSRVFGS